MLVNCESLSYPGNSSYFCGPKSLPCLHESAFVRIYCVISIHSTLLHLISLIHILIRHYPSIHVTSFVGVLIDNLHQTSIIGFVISRVCFLASVLFNILMNENLWKFSAWFAIYYAEPSKRRCCKFRKARSYWYSHNNKNIAKLPLMILP